jgi:hypothetical protein
MYSLKFHFQEYKEPTHKETLLYFQAAETQFYTDGIRKSQYSLYIHMGPNQSHVGLHSNAQTRSFQAVGTDYIPNNQTHT